MSEKKVLAFYYVWYGTPSRRNGGYYIDSWNTALSCNPDWIFVTSWNEWYEASQIEPSVEYGNDYITLTRQQVRRFKGS